MDRKCKREQQMQFQSWGNLALVGESLGVPQYSKVRNLSCAGCSTGKFWREIRN